jgi:hypothetical protein
VRSFAWITLLCLTATGVSFAQNTNPACPKLEIKSEPSVVEGDPIGFTVKLSGGDPAAEPMFNWTVSAGKILSGQGTAVIKVDSTGIGGQSVTATVDVMGYERACEATVSSTLSVEKRAAAVKAEEYGAHGVIREDKRLDNFALRLSQEPSVLAYIVSYGGRTSQSKEAQTAADNARDYLVNQRAIDPGRIVTVDGGFREQPMVELWLVPLGAKPPEATPTVDPSEVKPAKPMPKRTTKTSKAKPAKG